MVMVTEVYMISVLCCRDRATTDQHEYVPQDAVQALAAGWRDDPDTPTVLRSGHQGRAVRRGQ